MDKKDASLTTAAIASFLSERIVIGVNCFQKRDGSMGWEQSGVAGRGGVLVWLVK
jgi:hypothetical protein